MKVTDNVAICEAPERREEREGGIERERERKKIESGRVREGESGGEGSESIRGVERRE